MNNLVSVIVPVYNSEKYIKRCIESLICQNYKDIEIILVDDGSIDRSGEICDEYSKKDSRVITIHKKNGGVSSARNVGLKSAKGDFITFCDSDDWVEKDIYETLVNAINESHSEIACCKYITENLNLSNKYLETKLINPEAAVKLVINNNEYGGYLWNKMFSRNVIYDKELILFNQDIHILEDQLFVIRAISNCKKVSIIDNRLYHYEQNEGSALNSRMSEKSISQTTARELIYLELKSKGMSNEVLYLAWSELIKSCGLILKKIVFNNIVKDKKKYIKQVKKTINKHKKDFYIKKDFSIKDKLYYYLSFLYF